MKILFVQGQPYLPAALKFTLERKGFDPVVSKDTLHPKSVIRDINPGIVVADIRKGSGFNYVEEAKRKNVPVLVISENGGEHDLQQAFNKGADDYICMPLSFSELALRVCILTRLKITAVA